MSTPRGSSPRSPARGARHHGWTRSSGSSATPARARPSLLRLYGELADHAESVLLPLLLPDAPVVVWWPAEAPTVPGLDPVGRLAQRRVTDAAGAEDPMAALHARSVGYEPGDTDLSWTRITGWRALLAAALDLPHEPDPRRRGRLRGGKPQRRTLGPLARDRLKVPVKRARGTAQGSPRSVADPGR